MKRFPLPAILRRRLGCACPRAEGGSGGPASDTGRWGEAIAARWLAHQGYRIVGRRVRPNRRDELDLVARRGSMLVFIEVKTRRSEQFGRPAAAVDARKRHSLCRAAAAYLRKAGYPDGSYRFDVVEVVGEPDRSDPAVRHIEDAFRFDLRYRFPQRRG